MKRRNVIEVISLLFVCLMLYTGISKLLKFELAREQLTLMPLLEPVAEVFAWLLPLIEIVAAILIFIPKCRRVGLYSATALMVIFTAYVIYIISYDSKLPCTCGGMLEMLTWPQHLAFNVFFILLGLTAITMLKKQFRSEPVVNL